jgi:hypothetical protein
VGEDGGLIAGHARVLAARQLGIAEIPVMVAAGWTEAQKRAYVLADNQLAITGSGWDPELMRLELGELKLGGFDLSLTGFGDLELKDLLADQTEGLTDTALPRIVGELGGLAHLPWVITAFMLTATATAPVYGKLSDMHGRRPLFVVAITVFIAGSALCGLARSMTGLILFRGLQGLGAGGLMVLAQTAIADLVPPRQRGRYQGLFSGVFALCSVTGPVLGGVITMRCRGAGSST